MSVFQSGLGLPYFSMAPLTKSHYKYSYNFFILNKFKDNLSILLSVFYKYFSNEKSHFNSRYFIFYDYK